MAIDPKYVGKKYGPFTYTCGLEKMREFAYAVGGGVPSSSFGGSMPSDLHPYLYDEKVAKAGPYGGVIAFPTFAVTFALTRPSHLTSEAAATSRPAPSARPGR